MAYPVAPVNPIALLDTTTLVWSVPPLKDPNIPLLAYHSATLAYKLMLVAFGKLFYLLKKNLQCSNIYIYIFFREYYGWDRWCTK